MDILSTCQDEFVNHFHIIAHNGLISYRNCKETTKLDECSLQIYRIQMSECFSLLHLQNIDLPTNSTTVLAMMSPFDFLAAVLSYPPTFPV